MGLLKQLGTGEAYLKAGFLGFNKSGKTRTATELAIGTRELFGLKGQIAMFDTENGSEYVAPIVLKRTGKPLMGVKSRSFDDLMTVAKECEESGISVLIVDSVTHPWRELCQAYMKTLNARLKSRNKPPKARMDIQDIMQVKELWAPWPDLYLNGKLHVIICGRAGYEWSMEENEDTGKRELVKVGVKMKVETEFGFEPSLLVEMERIQDLEGDQTVMLRRATVLGDRFGVIDGKTCNNPTFEFFKPHIALLKPGEHTPVDTSIKSDVDVDEEGNPEWQREKKARVILCEEIQGVLVKHHPGQTAVDKSAKADLLEKAFGTRSWTKIEGLESHHLRFGLDHIRHSLGESEPLFNPDADELPTNEKE